MIEKLEYRVLFSVDVYPNGIAVERSYNGSETKFYCTQGNDKIMFFQKPDGWVDVYSGYEGSLNPGYPFTTFMAARDGVPTQIEVYGQNGDDFIYVTESVVGTTFHLDGGNDNDTLIGSRNTPDMFVGGAGTDTVTYAGRQEKLDLRKDGAANDGEPNEGDNIQFTTEIVIGGENDDVLWGGGGNDRLEGGAGRDKIFGGSGNDKLIGGFDDDTLDGGSGADSFDGGSGHDSASYVDRYANLVLSLDGVANDGDESVPEGDNILPNIETIKGGHGNDHIDLNGNTNGQVNLVRVGIGGPGNDVFKGSIVRDVFSGGDGDDNFVTSLGNDYYMGDAGIDRIDYFHHVGEPGVNVSLDGNDNDGLPGEGDNVRSDIENVRGSGGNDTIRANVNGAAIKNRFWGLAGNDQLDAYGGDDEIEGGDGYDRLEGGDGNDKLDGGNQDDALLGGPGNDKLIGGSTDNGIDVLSGHAGNDLLDGGGGRDDLSGGEGFDTATYAGSNSPVNVDIDGVADDGKPGENDNVMLDVEGVIGSAFNDVIRGSSAWNTLNGGAGADQLFGGDGVDTLLGGDGNDQLFGEAANDILDGGNGGDTFDGGAGTDTADYSARTRDLKITLDGVANDGTLHIEHDNVLANVENVRAGSGDDVIEGPQSGSTWNEFWGGAGEDILRGFGGIDTLHGDGGIDILYGGDDTDVLDGGAAGDFLDGGSGDDQAWYGDRTKTIVATLDGLKNDGEQGEKDLIYDNVEGITGGFADDTLTGNSLANKIYGQGGNDTITGGGGADQLFGGFGNDTLIARDGVIDLLYGGSGYDRARTDNNDDLHDVESLLA